MANRVLTRRTESGVRPPHDRPPPRRSRSREKTRAAGFRCGTAESAGGDTARRATGIHRARPLTEPLAAPRGKSPRPRGTGAGRGRLPVRHGRFPATRRPRALARSDRRPGPADLCAAPRSRPPASRNRSRPGPAADRAASRRATGPTRARPPPRHSQTARRAPLDLAEPEGRARLPVRHGGFRRRTVARGREGTGPPGRPPRRSRATCGAPRAGSRCGATVFSRRGGRGRWRTAAPSRGRRGTRSASRCARTRPRRSGRRAGPPRPARHRAAAPR